MKPSAQRRRDAVSAAIAFTYGRLKEIPSHFDERQQRIFNKYVEINSSKRAYYEDLDNEMWVAYTGMSREEYNSRRISLKNKLDDKYNEELFENADYTHDELEFFLKDVAASSVEISDDGCEDDVLTNLSLSVGV